MTPKPATSFARTGTTPPRARRFALSINLNADHEGGDLRFPNTARAPIARRGGACVFSCSILLEVTPDARGERFDFLPIFYDRAAAQIRGENLNYLDPALTA
ncbi:hypothetical protein GCM10009116_13680 [Brevundimonas basaltis]|uniref:Uncharacterized protein n=1 Tax=Brevundimonas basaltis TaxID=472166 RepID=A0A7W8HWS5_9CAUL|nr:hypothetical protein [Brevundimonas basaltis]MBB5291319.1 hypothetical protein [Brevundimonas basaltis]